MIEIKTLGSGSSGNCYLLKTSKECLLLECGMPYKKIIGLLDYRLGDVSGCLVTHGHKDHSGSLKEISKAGIDVYASEGTFKSVGILNHRTHIVKAGEQFKARGFTVLPFDTQHDCTGSLAFLIQHEEVGKLLFATDTYYLKYTFNGLTHVMIEANYSTSIVKTNIENGSMNPVQAKRLFKSHFSIENVKEFLKANDLSQVQKIYLIHLSDRNSNAQEFQKEIEALTAIPTEVC